MNTHNVSTPKAALRNSGHARRPFSLQAALRNHPQDEFTDIRGAFGGSTS